MQWPSMANDSIMDESYNNNRVHELNPFATYNVQHHRHDTIIQTGLSIGKITLCISFSIIFNIKNRRIS